MGIKHERVVITRDKGKAEDWNADHVIDGNVNFNQFQSLNHVIENRTTFPAGPVPGQMIFRSDFPNTFIWSGTKWMSTTPVATIVVAADGSGHTTNIQTGINMLPAGGGAVYIKEGTYLIDTQITINKSNVSLFGAGKSTILRGAPGEVILYASGKNYLSIRDLYLTSQEGPPADKGIVLSGSIGSFIESCWIDNIWTAGIELAGTITGATIRSCNVSAAGAGIYIRGDDGVIESCYIDGGAYGIFASAAAERYRVVGNIIINSVYEGIHGTTCDDFAFVGNYVGDCNNKGIVLVNSDRNTFTGNNIVNNGNDGIEISGTSDRNLIVSNIIYNNGGLAIDDGGTNTLKAGNITA